MGKGISRAGRLVTTGVLSLASAGALTGAFLAAGAQAASATDSSATVTYACSLLSTLNFDVPVTMSATAPSSVAPGGAVSLSGYQATASIPASTVDKIITFAGNIKSISGTLTALDVNIKGGSPATVNVASSPIAFTAAVKKGSPATLTVPASPVAVGGITAGSSGSVVISPGNITIAATVKGIPVTVNCAPPSSVPSSATFTVAIGTSTSTTVSVPTSHTGEPWAGWPYWLLVALFGLAGFGTLGRAARIRRQKA
jgi:hypothetical protein